MPTHVEHDHRIGSDGEEPTRGHPLKHLFYIHALSGGGAERVWCVLASALAERGHEVMMVVDTAAEDNLPYLSAAVELHVLGGSHAQNVMRLARFMRIERPDIAIAALAASDLKLTAAAALAGMLDRTVISFHGYAESEPQRLSQFAFAATPLLTRMTAQTLCVSDGLLDYMRKRWHASGRHSRRIYNPVAVEGTPADLSAADLARRAPIVLAVGRFAPYKNFLGLVRAFASVKATEARLVILGEGQEVPLVEAEVARLGLQGRVDLRGYRAEPWTTFREARCFVLPSHSESFGLVVVEALAHGLPVIATACDGPKEIVAAPCLGTIVPKNDVDSLARAIDAFLAEPGDPVPRMRRADVFSVAAATREYEEVFQNVAQAARPRRTGVREASSSRGRRWTIALAGLALVVLACSVSLQRHAHGETHDLHTLHWEGKALASWLRL